MFLKKFFSRAQDNEVKSRDARVTPVLQSAPVRPFPDSPRGRRKSVVASPATVLKNGRAKIRRVPSNLNADDPTMSHSETREKTLDGLILSMRGNMANLRSKLTDVEHIHLSLQSQEEQLNVAMGESEDAKNQLHEFREEMESAWKLAERKPDWNAAIERFLEACEPSHHPRCRDFAAHTPARHRVSFSRDPACLRSHR